MVKKFKTLDIFEGSGLNPAVMSHSGAEKKYDYGEFQFHSSDHIFPHKLPLTLYF
jgi:hypothetical protein